MTDALRCEKCLQVLVVQTAGGAWPTARDHHPIDCAALAAASARIAELEADNAWLRDCNGEGVDALEQADD